MGNSLGRRRQVVDEKYTRPQGLYQIKDVDHKKLRKLILDSKLAPCYPGYEDCNFDLEECPICFLYYPSLNRSKCCMKGICTECFLQMKPPHSTSPIPCPFCKSSNYTVEYRGMRSKEEKGMEQVEEQRVIEAKIRMQQQEFLDEEERMQRRQEISSSSNVMTSGEVPYTDVSSRSLAAPSFSESIEGDEIISSEGSCATPTIRQPSDRQNGDPQFDLDLDDIMMMEAIWLSLRENGAQRHLVHDGAVPAESFDQEDHSLSPTIVSLAGAPSPSGGLACAIATLAERQHMDGDSTNHTEIASTYARRPSAEEMVEGSVSESWIEVSPDTGRAVSREEDSHELEVGEAGTSYTPSDETVIDVAGGAGSPLLPDGIEDRFQTNVTWPILPESFEEQMMLAMAVSIADAQARTNSQGVSWL